MKNTKRAFEEAQLCLIRFEAEDILTASDAYKNENGDIELPAVPFPDDDE